MDFIPKGAITIQMAVDLILRKRHDEDYSVANGGTTAQADPKRDVLVHYSDMVLVVYEDSLATERTLQTSISNVLAKSTRNWLWRL